MSLVFGDTRNSLLNRKEFLANLGIDYQDLVCAKQIHSSKVAYIYEKDKGRGALSYDSAIADTDALITDKKNIPLAIFTADCLPIFLYGPKTASIGLVHAGWQSTKENITTKTVKLMQKEFNTKPQDLYVGFGPAIRDCCYEVDREFQDFFSYGLKLRNNNYYLDLAGINQKELLDLGVRQENIFDSGVCTSCQNNTFFSFRREGKACGRMMSVMMLK
jgi:hypothetical protein